jgi:hypothetical protein
MTARQSPDQDEKGSSDRHALTCADKYTRLHSTAGQIHITLNEGKDRAQQAVEQVKIRTGREIGKSLHGHLLKYKHRAEYGKPVVAQLADDLGLHRRRLYEMQTFHRTFPIVRSIAQFNLSWTHYLKIIKLPSPETREYYIKRTEEHHWMRPRSATSHPG